MDNRFKKQVAALPAVKAAGEEISRAFDGAGRVVIRPSGTEPKVRVMVEGRDPALVAEKARYAAQVVEQAVAQLK